MNLVTVRGLPADAPPPGYMSFSSKGTTDGVVFVPSARLLQREDRKFNSHAEEMERYINLDTMEARRFWHPLLMTYNNEVIEI